MAFKKKAGSRKKNRSSPESRPNNHFVRSSENTDRRPFEKSDFKHKNKKKNSHTSRNGPDRNGPEAHGKERGKTRDSRESKPSEIPQTVSNDAILKSQESIKSWLNAGKELRDAHLAKVPPMENPKDLALDPWQQQVLELLRLGESVIVDAPTTAGKTRAVEVFFAQNIDNPNFRAAYTTPVKSLSNDKVRELRAMFGEKNVGISTGDIKENLDAPIVVATLESYRNSLLGTEPDLGRSLVIFDEYHYLQDEGRGSAWEEAIILTPPSCQVLLLSASVGNSTEFTDWISSLSGKRCTLVQTLHRPVPLTNLVYYGKSWLTEENLPGEALKNINPSLQQRSVKHEDLVTSLPGLLNLNLFPCILYAGKRIDCENLAIQIERSLEPLPQEQSEKIGAVLMAAHKDVGSLSFIKPSFRRMIQTYGVAYHHSGLAPAARIAIERLVKDGLLRFCVATMGLSLGINFSVRCAMISDYQRPGESGMTNYAEGEVLQMLGRAGRRGKDVIGFSLWPNVESYVRMAKSKREPCNSRLRTDPTTLLGLLGRGLSLGMLEGIYAKSFMKFQNKKIDLRLIRKPDVENKLGATLPCASPAAEYARSDLQSELEKKKTHKPSSSVTGVGSDFLCTSCNLKPSCHNYICQRKSSKLASMHLHLHKVGCISREETLTPLGSIARYFPQSGGMLLSKLILEGQVHPDRLVAACELIAALCLPRFKEPGTDSGYRFPFEAAQLERQLEEFYPKDLFLEAYDQPYGRRTWFQLKEWNPNAGWIIRQWLTGSMDWPSLVKNGTTEVFGVGDLMGLMYRIATYLQSMAGMGLPDFKKPAIALRRELLKSPLDMTL